MAVKGLEQTQSRLDQVKKFGGLVVVAILAAALVVGALVFTGVLSFLTVPRIRVLGFVVPSEWVVFIGAFTVALTLIIGYVYYAQLVLSTLAKAKKLWMGLPDLLQSVVLALQAVALVAGLIFLTDRYILVGEVLGYQQTTLVGAPVAVGLAILVLTVVVRDRGWSLMEWARTFYLSALLAGLVGALVGFAFAGVYIDNPPEAGLQRTLALVFTTPPGAFLVAWGALLYMLLRRRKTIQDSFVTGLLTRSGYAQMRQVETPSVSLVTGLVLAVGTAAVVGLFGTAPDSAVQRALLSVVLVWPVVTIATSLGWPSRERFNIVIEDINVRSSTGNREVTLRNTASESVRLHGAKVTDAHNRLYQIRIDIELGAGEGAKFEIPESFEFATHGRYELAELPFGVALMRDATEPAIVTRRGRQYVLVWIDQQDEYVDAEAEAVTGTVTAA
jgi:hypothetical protein